MRARRGGPSRAGARRPRTGSASRHRGVLGRGGHRVVPRIAIRRPGEPLRDRASRCTSCSASAPRRRVVPDVSLERLVVQLVSRAGRPRCPSPSSPLRRVGAVGRDGRGDRFGGLAERGGERVLGFAQAAGCASSAAARIASSRRLVCPGRRLGLLGVPLRRRWFRGGPRGFAGRLGVVEREPGSVRVEGPFARPEPPPASVFASLGSARRIFCSTSGTMGLSGWRVTNSWRRASA